MALPAPPCSFLTSATLLLASAALAVFSLHCAEAYVHDQILPHHTPKDCACVPWTNNASSVAMWESAEARVKAASSCSLPANALTPDPNLPEYSPQAGWCFCDAPPFYTFCQPADSFPSQINLLVLNATSIVINFITGNPLRAEAVVTAQVRQNSAKGEGITSFEGFSTLYKDSTSSRHLSYHHVTLHSLKERTTYEYRVRVEASFNNVSASQWSDWIGFKTLYSSGETRFAIYADMGAFASQFAKPSVPAMSRQNVGNLVDDLAMGKIDFAVHSGDLAYEFEVYGGARGDGFMDGYSQFLSHAPWVPGWGNHEYLEEDRGNRLANITAGLIAEKKRVNPLVSRMHYSVDIGLVHILQLDMSPYWCHFSGCISVDTCGFPDEWVKNASDTHNPDVRYDFEGYREDMLAYVRADLEVVNRTQTPWVIVTGHYPLYETYDDFDSKNMASERASVDGRARGRGQASSSAPMPSKAQALADFEPLLREFSVDIFFAGHDHNYETTWPVYNFSAAQKNYENPKATVHIVSGSAGPPEWDAFVAEAPDWSRHPRLQVNSYSRMTVWNGSVLAFEQVANDNGTVVDSFTIKKGI